MNENFAPLFIQQIHAVGQWFMRHARENPVKSLTTAAFAFGTLLLVPIFLEIGELPQLDMPSLLPLLVTIAVGGAIGLASLVALPLVGGFIARFAPGAPRWAADGWALAIYLSPTVLVATSLVVYALNYPTWPTYTSWLPVLIAVVGPVLAVARVWLLRTAFSRWQDAAAGWASLAWNSAALTLLASLLLVSGVQAVIYERSSLQDLALAVVLWTIYFCVLIWLATRIVAPQHVWRLVACAVVAAVVLFVCSGGWFAASRSLAHKIGWANFTAKLAVTDRGCTLLNRGVGTEVCRIDRASGTQHVCPVLVRSRIGSPIFLSFSATTEGGRWPDHDRLRHVSLPREDVINVSRIASRKGAAPSTEQPDGIVTHLRPGSSAVGAWLQGECDRRNGPGSSENANCWRRPKFEPLGVRQKTWTGYVASPRLRRYSMGLRAPSEILIRSALYQRM